MKLWEDRKTVEYIAKLSGWERILRGLELTELSYEVLKSGIQQRFKLKSKKKVLQMMQKLLWER